MRTTSQNPWTTMSCVPYDNRVEGFSTQRSFPPPTTGVEVRTHRLTTATKAHRIAGGTDMELECRHSLRHSSTTTHGVYCLVEATSFSRPRQSTTHQLSTSMLQEQIGRHIARSICGEDGGGVHATNPLVDIPRPTTGTSSTRIASYVIYSASSPDD